MLYGSVLDTKRFLQVRALLIGALLACLWLPHARGESCLVSPDERVPGAGYELLVNWSPEDLQLLVDEYAYRHDFADHQAALDAGFGPGDVVYGEALRPGGIFRPEAVRSWRQAYAQGRQRNYARRIEPRLQGRDLDSPLVQTALDSCLRAPAWTKVAATDACRFTFSAGVRSASQALRLSAVRLTVVGGRCEAWPKGALTVAGHSVQCERSGNGSVTVTLHTTRGQPLQQFLPPLQTRKAPDEPVLEAGGKPQIEVISLYRTRDFRVVEYGRSCPTCRLYAADIRPSVRGATIVSIGVVASSGSAGWLRCPAGYRCGVPEFSPPDQRHVSGCAGQTSCRVWRLADGDGQAYDTIQIEFQVNAPACRNCPEGVPYEEARKRWERAQAQAGQACPVFPDPPPQVLAR
jgi:hypothetical protein